MLSTLTLALALAAPLPEDPRQVVIRASKHAGGNAQSVALSADGKYLAAGFGGPSNGRFPLKPNGGGVFVWERDTGKQILAHGEFGDILAVGFSRDSRFLAYARIYTPGDSVRADTTVLIDLESGQVVKKWSDAGFAFSPTENLMLVAGRKGADVFDLEKQQVVRTLAIRNARTFAFSADGKTAAALCYFWEGNRGTKTGLAVFSPSDEKPRLLLQDETMRTAQALAVSPDGKHVVTGHVDGLAQVCDAEKRAAAKSLRIDTKQAVFPFFASRGQALVLATQPANGVNWSYDATDPSGFKFTKRATLPSCELHFFDYPALTAKRTWKFEDAAFRTIHARFGSGRDEPEYNPARFVESADGKVLAAGCNGVCIVEAATGKLIRTFEPRPPADR